MFRKVLVRCCAPGLSAVLLIAQAPPAPAQAPLTLAEAIARASAQNPELQAGAFSVQAARAREARAAQSPAVSLGADLEDFAGSGELSGADALQTTLRLSGVIELGGKRGARISLAERETQVVEAEQRGRRLDLLAQVAARFVEVAARQEALAVSREATRLSEATVERTGQRTRVGAAPAHELVRAEIQLSLARTEAEHAERELASARVRLASVWGADRPDFEAVSADLFGLPATKPLQQLTAEIDASPAIQTLLSRERVAEAQINLARSARNMDVSWFGGVRHVESLGDSALVASLAVPLFTRSRAEPGVREAQALRARVPLELQAARLEANATLFELYQDLAQARLAVNTLRTQVLPQAESVLRSLDDAFRMGRTSFLELAAAQRQLLDVRRDAANAAAEFHILLIEIERLTGTIIGADEKESGENR